MTAPAQPSSGAEECRDLLPPSPSRSHGKRSRSHVRGQAASAPRRPTACTHRLERVPDQRPDPPHVEVGLPGGRTVPGRLLRWRRDAAGRWWAEITTHVPAGAVRQVDGEDYTAVPREPAVPTERVYLLVSYVQKRPEPLLTVHELGCFTVKENLWRYRIQEISALDARTMLAKFADTKACTLCHPEP